MSLPTTIQPYLFFGGRADEALVFYRDALGAELGLRIGWNESPDPPPPGMLTPGFENKVMHAEFCVGGALVMVCDGSGPSEGAQHQGFSLALSLPDVAAVDRAFAGLSQGGQVSMPLSKTFWSERFGMLTDRFGIGWMVMVAAQPPAA